MKISYADVISWFRLNWQLLLISQVICAIGATVYLQFKPAIYEASFAIQMPMEERRIDSGGANVPWVPVISALDFLRAWQNPLRHSKDLIVDCMGSDTNKNRKNLISATQIFIQKRGDTLGFTLRLAGRDQVKKCAETIELSVLTELNNIYEQRQISLFNEANATKLIPRKITKAEIDSDIRLSDVAVEPNSSKTYGLAAVLALLLSLFGAALKEKYRA